MEHKQNKIQKASAHNPDATGLGNPEVAAQVEVTTNKDAIEKGDDRYIPAMDKGTNS